MRIVVFGAAGSVGSCLVAEALARGHEVTAVVRDQAKFSSLPPRALGRICDATSIDQVAALTAGQDLAISATRPPAGNEQDLVATAKALLAGVAQSGVRLLLVGGAASLKVPDTGGLVVDDPRYVPAAVRDIAIACRMQFEACAADAEADWTYISPPALLVPGARTGSYRSGGDELLVDSHGSSRISIEDFAMALLDEAESPKHRRARFTVAAHAFDVSERDVMIETPDGTADCYFTHPVSGAHPGVIIWPDVLGLRPAYRKIGKRLAESGYSVLVINPHYRKAAAPIGLDWQTFNETAGREKATALSNAIRPYMTATDAVAFAGYLDQQNSVDSQRKLGTVGYCMGGAMAIRTAAAMPDRIGAIASFHGSKLVTQDPGSTHLLITKTRASALIAIAENDDEKEPCAKQILSQAYDEAKLPAEIEVYPGTTHGWCALDTMVYNQAQAERAWLRL
ncbi:MAG TPA: dienelactone hydrolase family protein, partial [Acidobacteriaceae bacterium]|nr:dienelactone hydrolase family protein [Acidobacteriaceae bacterium]